MRLPAGLAQIAAPLAIWLVGYPAQARPTPDLDALFASGDYLDAARRAEAEAGPDDLAFAARSLLAQCMTSEKEPDVTLVNRAEADARTALQSAPTQEEAKLQLAIALSLKSRTMNLIDAWNAGLGSEGRDLAVQVLAKDPSNYYAHGFLAVWNLEVRRRGGALGGKLLNASVSEGQRQYEEASRLAPEDAGIHWQFARALVALDAKRYSAEASDILRRAIASNAEGHVESVMRARAAKLAEALKGDPRQAQALARSML